MTSPQFPMTSDNQATGFPAAAAARPWWRNRRVLVALAVGVVQLGVAGHRIQAQNLSGGDCLNFSGGRVEKVGCASPEANLQIGVNADGDCERWLEVRDDTFCVHSV